MPVTKQSVFVWVVVGLCMMSSLVVVYKPSSSFFGQDPMSERLMVPLGSKGKLLSLEKDRPVVFLSDHSRERQQIVAANVQSRRTDLFESKGRTSFLDLNTRAAMLKTKIADDYHYCHKEASFLGPFDYLSNSKNPCWYHTDGQLRCVPYFYLAGFSKSGTSDMFNRISSHPQVTGNGKEKHWLDFLRYFPEKDSIEIYSSMFSRATKNIEKALQLGGRNIAVTGDGTPCYAWDSLYWHCYEGNRNMTEPKYTNADVIHRLNPQAKIIMMLRDPVTRLYSRHLTWINRLPARAFKDPSPYRFHTLTSRAVKLYSDCFRDWTPRHCAYNGTLYGQVQSRLGEGMYSVYIRDWLKVFPRNQLYIIKFEDYVKDIPGYLHKIYRFLDLAPLSHSSVLEIAQKRKANVGHHYDIGPMMNETMKLLREFYAPFNKDLQFVLDDPSFAWGYE